MRALLLTLLLAFPAAAQAELAKPPGTPPLTSKQAATKVVRVPENRPENYTPNQTIPTMGELQAWRPVCFWPRCNTYVNGRFKGTTDEIIQWAAAKWGFSPRIFRAVATQESWWRQSQLGDLNPDTGEYDSFGLFQIRRPWHCSGECRIMRDSSAMNADYYGGILRAYYDGTQTWLNDEERGKDYEAGDLWGSVGAWYAGRWWTSGARWYTDSVKDHFLSRTWAQSGF